MKRLNVFISLALACVLLFGGSFVATGAVGIPDTDEDADKATVSGSMEEICSKGDLTLYASLENGEFAVKNRATGEIWYSNPTDREDDAYSGSDRTKTFSQLTLRCIEEGTLLQSFATSYEAEINEGLSVKKHSDGFTATYKFYDIKISVPLKITLTEQGFNASIDVTKIREDSNKLLLEIGLLPYFGASGVSDEGYIVVPDGCGALIEFNSGKQNLAPYNEPVYGRDTTLLGDTKTKRQENSALPLFGMKNGNKGFAAIITEGDAAASVVAGVSKKGSGYNNVYTSFTLRSLGKVNISSSKLDVYEQNDSHLDVCKVEYHLLGSESADYVGIAKTYSKYLLESGVQAKTKESLSMLMEIYGAAKVKRSVLGIPTEVTQELTTFAQAGDMVEELKQSGVNAITLLYNDYDRASVSNKLPAKITPERKLGGKSGFKKLKSRLDDMGAELVSIVDLNSYQNGFLKNKNSALSLGGLPGVTYQFDLGTNQPEDDVKPYYHLAPEFFAKYAKRFAKNYNSELYGALGLESFSEELYSDFSKSHSSGRQQTIDAFGEGAEILTEKSGLYVRGGSAWALKYTDYIYDMPSDTSHTDLESKAIPLYQLAVSGIVPYSLEAVNRSVEPENALLKCVEYGADIKFDFTYEDLGITGEPSLSYIDGTHYKRWSKYAVESYLRISEISDIISGEMLAHEQIAEDVFVTTYAGGSVAVNYSDEDVKIGSNTVKAEDFLVLKEAK